MAGSDSGAWGSQRLQERNTVNLMCTQEQRTQGDQVEAPGEYEMRVEDKRHRALMLQLKLFKSGRSGDCSTCMLTPTTNTRPPSSQVHA